MLNLFIYLGKAFDKQTKTMEDQEKKTSWCFRKFKIKTNRGRKKTDWG